MKQSITVKILRWISVLPSSIIGALCLTVINNMIILKLSGYSSSILSKFIFSISSGALFAGIFIIIGSYVAPIKNKKYISIILAAILLFLTIINILYGKTYDFQYKYQYIELISQIITSIICCIYFFRESDNNQQIQESCRNLPKRFDSLQ